VDRKASEHGKADKTDDRRGGENHLPDICHRTDDDGEYQNQEFSHAETRFEVVDARNERCRQGESGYPEDHYDGLQGWIKQEGETEGKSNDCDGEGEGDGALPTMTTSEDVAKVDLFPALLPPFIPPGKGTRRQKATKDPCTDGYHKEDVDGAHHHVRSVYRQVERRIDLQSRTDRGQVGGASRVHPDEKSREMGALREDPTEDDVPESDGDHDGDHGEPEGPERLPARHRPSTEINGVQHERDGQDDHYARQGVLDCRKLSRTGEYHRKKESDDVGRDNRIETGEARNAPDDGDDQKGKTYVEDERDRYHYCFLPASFQCGEDSRQDPEPRHRQHRRPHRRGFFGGDVRHPHEDGADDGDNDLHHSFDSTPRPPVE
jgi:hypothetical protein